jgi:hypothetical protein
VVSAMTICAIVVSLMSFPHQHPLFWKLGCTPILQVMDPCDIEPLWCLASCMVQHVHLRKTTLLRKMLIYFNLCVVLVKACNRCIEVAATALKQLH